MARHPRADESRCNSASPPIREPLLVKRSLQRSKGSPEARPQARVPSKRTYIGQRVRGCEYSFLSSNVGCLLGWLIDASRGSGGRSMLFAPRSVQTRKDKIQIDSTESSMDIAPSETAVDASTDAAATPSPSTPAPVTNADFRRFLTR